MGGGKLLASFLYLMFNYQTIYGMNRKIIFILPLIFLLASLNNTFSADKGTTKATSYFPINDNRSLVYSSSFGESITKYFSEGEFTVSSSNSDKFKYRQTLVIKEDGVYVKETYQYLKVLLFVKKEETYTYNKPMLRFPLPLISGREWKWEGEEYSKSGASKVKIAGKVLGKEFVKTKAGNIEAIKIESIVEGSAGAKNKVTEWFAKDIGLIKAKIIVEGGGMMGFMRDFLGYGTLEFELTEIRNN
jgi:hypothetical protein